METPLRSARSNRTASFLALGADFAVPSGSGQDSEGSFAHARVQTSPGGAESRGIGHGPDEDRSVERVHRTY